MRGLLRTLVPSWRFFETAGWLPALSMRFEGEWDWHPVLVPPRRGLRHLFFNPEGNLHLALQTVLERLVMEINELPEGGTLPASSENYGLVRNLCSSRAGGRSFQFRITGEGENILVSPVMRPAGGTSGGRIRV